MSSAFYYRVDYDMLLLGKEEFKSGLLSLFIPDSGTLVSYSALLLMTLVSSGDAIGSKACHHPSNYTLET